MYKLNSNDPDIVESGVQDLHELLKSLAPSIQKLHATGSIDSRLSSFISLQDNFQYNLCSELLPAYKKLAESSSRNAAIYSKMNTALMGLLLIHPDSRKVFGRTANMLLILSFLDPANTHFEPKSCHSFVSLLLHILLRNLRNMRIFEECGGCLILIRLLQPSSEQENSSPVVTEAQQNLHFKVVEFLIFYMTDETELKDGTVPVRTIAEKIGFIKPEFPAIEDLIDNLNSLSVSSVA